MNLFGLMDTSGSAMQAERMRAEVVAANMANAETTRTASGGPYRRQEVVFAANRGDPGFLDSLNSASASAAGAALPQAFGDGLAGQLARAALPTLSPSGMVAAAPGVEIAQVVSPTGWAAFPLQAAAAGAGGTSAAASPGLASGATGEAAGKDDEDGDESSPASAASLLLALHAIAEKAVIKTAKAQIARVTMRRPSWTFRVRTPAGSCPASTRAWLRAFGPAGWSRTTRRLPGTNS